MARSRHAGLAPTFKRQWPNSPIRGDHGKVQVGPFAKNGASIIALSRALFRWFQRSASTGNALLSVLIMMGALTPLGAFVVMHARLDIMIQHQVGRAAAAFAVAESGLEHARAELRLDSTYDRLLNGPDQRPATADDGQFVFRKRHSLPVAFGFEYALRVERRSATSLEVISTATGPSGASHSLALGVVREEALVPAAASSTAARPKLNLGAACRITGHDKAGKQPALPGIGVVAATVATQLLTEVPTDAAQRIAGHGGAPSLTEAAMPSAEELASSFAAKRTSDVGPALNGAIGSGIAVSSGTLDIATANGDGVLIVNGNLNVSGVLTFSGLVIVLGDVVFDAGSDVHIDGGLLQGLGNGVIACLGQGNITYDSGAIGAVDRTFPDILPHRGRVVGWRDLS